MFVFAFKSPKSLKVHHSELYPPPKTRENGASRQRAQMPGAPPGVLFRPSGIHIRHTAHGIHIWQQIGAAVKQHEQTWDLFGDLSGERKNYLL